MIGDLENDLMNDGETLRPWEPHQSTEADRLTAQDYRGMTEAEARQKDLHLPWSIARKKQQEAAKWSKFWDENGRITHWQELARVPKEEALHMPVELYHHWQLARIRQKAQSEALKARNEAIREIRVTAKPRDLKTPLPIGKTLQDLRKSRKISQTQAAEFFNLCGLPCSHNLISKWERGGSEPRLTDLVALSLLYGSNLLDLMIKESEKPERDEANAFCYDRPDPTGRI